MLRRRMKNYLSEPASLSGLFFPLPKNLIAWAIRDLSADPAAAENFFGGVKNCGLPGGDGALRLVENYLRGACVERRDGCSCGFVAIANFHFGAHRILRRLERDPIYIAHFASRRAKLGVLTDDQPIIFAIHRHHINFAPGSKSEALALADGVAVQSF